jgi:hypothetical protein
MRGPEGGEKGLANCRAQSLDPEDYLIEVLKRLPHNATPEQAAELPPARIAADLPRMLLGKPGHLRR